MKKVLVLMLTFILCMGMVACGSSGETKTEKSVSAVADVLGFSGDGDFKAYEMIGAEDGAAFDGYGIYIYDENSDAYKDVTGNGYDMGLGLMAKATAYNSGVVLIYEKDGDPDQAIIDKFNEIVFE